MNICRKKAIVFIVSILLAVASVLSLTSCSQTKDAIKRETVITAPPPSISFEVVQTQEPMPFITYLQPLPTETIKDTHTPLPLEGIVIGLDPGHQAHQNTEKEPVEPGSSVMKKKVSAGTWGSTTHIYEYEVVLNVALELRDLLKQAGATVYMTREVNDVDISNIERAKFFNEHNVDLGIRIHCNSSDDTSKAGAFILIPDKKHTKHFDFIKECANNILSAYGDATGISTKYGIVERDDQTGFNWCSVPVINIEMGHMSNKTEELKLVDSNFQKKMARGIFNGVAECFKK